MKRVRSTNTKPELAFHKALKSLGIKHDRQAIDLPGKPDIVIRSHRIAVFIDGDFWHGGQWSKRNLSSLEDQFRKSESKDYWTRKIYRNMDRDLLSTSNLLALGWRAIRFWESDIQKRLGDCVKMVEGMIGNTADAHDFSVAADRTFADFFAGIGLMRMGLERQGWSTLFANDIDPQKHQMYETHFGDASNHFYLGDVHQIAADQIPPVTLASACFPCNDLSLAGARDGLAGKQSSAFWGFISWLRNTAARPPLVLLENVPGFLTSHEGADFRQALLALNELGYDVDSFIVDAARFVPQSRSRLFVVGTLSAEGSASVNDALCEIDESALRPKALTRFISLNRDIRWKIRTLPRPPKSRKRLSGVLERLPDSAPEWWSRERAEYLFRQMSPKHQKIAREMMTDDGWSYGTAFRRIRNGKSMAELRSDGIAGCLRTPRGGSAKQILFRAGNGEYSVRHLTPRECARLMGADDYRIEVDANQALFGFGDAVCVPVIEWIAKHYLNPILIEAIHGRPLFPAHETTHAVRTKSA